MVLALGAIIMIYYKSRPFCFWKEVKLMLADFLLAVLAGIVATVIVDLIRKWLD